MRKITFLLTLLLMYVGVMPMKAKLVQFSVDTNKAYTIKTNGTYKQYLYQNDGKILRSSVSASSAQPNDESYYFRFVEEGGTAANGTQTYKVYYIQPVSDIESYVYNNSEKIGYSSDAADSKKMWFVLHDESTNSQCIMYTNYGQAVNYYWYAGGETQMQLMTGPGLTSIYSTGNPLIIEEVPGYEFVDDEVLSAKKDELKEKIQKANELLDKAGFSISPQQEMALQVTNPNANFYLSSNADHNTGGADTDGAGIAGLIDGITTGNYYFHTRWGGTDPREAHYIQVDLGDGQEITDFLFDYTTRDANYGNTSPAPTKIEVYGGNSSSNVSNLITTFSRFDSSNPLPTHYDRMKTWTSNLISSTDSYRYLRFVVTESTGPSGTKYNGYYFFCMAEFNLWLPAKTVVTNNDYKGKEEELNELNQLIVEAESKLSSSSLDNIQTAIDDLDNKMSELVVKTPINLTLAEISNTDKLLYGLEGYIGTFSAPYATAIPNGVTAYYASPAEINGTNTITLTPLKATGTSVLGVPSKFGVILVSATQNITMSPIEDRVDNPENAFGNTADGSVEMGKNCYVLARGDQGIGLYQATEGTTLAANKAYLQLDGTAGTSALRLVLDETVTGINGVATEKADAPIYDLSGRRVLNTVKGGIYIQNGKKFIVK